MSEKVITSDLEGGVIRRTPRLTFAKQRNKPGHDLPGPEQLGYGSSRLGRAGARPLARGHDEVAAA